MMKGLAIWIALTGMFAAAADARAAGPDLAALLNGVKEICVPGAPGPVCVFSEGAFAVIVDDGKTPAVVAAAARLGQGRVVALGHNGYFDEANARTADTARFLANAAAWAAAGSPRNGDRLLGLRGCRGMEAVLGERGAKCRTIDGGDFAAKLADLDVVLLPAGEIHDRDVAVLEAFVRRGGGIVCGVPAWGYLQTHPGTALNDMPANRLFAKAGLVWADGTVLAAASKRFRARANLSPLLNAKAALAAVAAEAQGKAKLSAADSAIATAALTRAAQSIPPDDKLLLPELERVAAEHRPEGVVSEKTDLLQSKPLGRLALTFDLNRDRALPAEQVKANPLAAAFPGPVPAAAARVKREVEVDLAIPDWHSTGLYAAPGQVIAVTLPPGAPTNLKLRIGAHSDRLWHLDQWHRAPEIDRVWPLKPGVNKAAASFGGLVYVVVPANSTAGAAGGAGAVKLTIENAVEAPLFVLGKTDAVQWRQKLRDLPGPWAELGSKKIFLTVPSQFVRKLDDPEALMTWWDRVADGAADLYQIPRERPRPERYVADVQISAGYMHSGYPIMTHLDAAPQMVDLPALATRGNWGLFHELGHNHQKPDWTFAGTVEVTNNLLPLYLLETLCNSAPLHGSFTPQARQKAEKKYIGGGADFEVWQKEPFTALIMYQQLRDAFGWETYQKVFAEYRDLPPEQRPKTELEKHDQWMMRFSRACGRNLGPFFQYWGVPTSEEARKKVGDLPGWEWDGEGGKVTR